VSGAEVEIWHCNVAGVYSGDDVESGEFCTGGDADAEQAYFFRGRARSGADGLVTFDTTFPGWYSSRAVHIHFLVRRAADAGESGESGTQVISKVFFPEALVAAIFADVEGYAARGQPDTTFATDTVLREVDDPSIYVVDYARMPDGAMLAWKTLALSDDDRC
jgi:protocatechuate 3,4-dioxygenase beta subunit